MRIRRRDKEAHPTPSPNEPSSPPAHQGPTSMDPVKSLIAEASPSSSSVQTVQSAPEPPMAPPASPSPAPSASPASPVATQAPAEPTSAAAPVAEALVSSPSTAPEPEAEMADEPIVEKSARPVRDGKTASSDHTMRPPSISEDADQLLNGSKPAARELPRVIAIANQKGGVGKTTTTVNLGAALAEQGYRVLVVDLDPQGNATTGLGVEARNFEFSMYDVIMRDQPLEDCIEPTSVKNLFVAPATIDLAGVEIELVPAFSRELKLKRAVDSVVEDFDFILIDCPPSLGLITVNGLAAADEVLVPIQCEYYALEGLTQLLRNVHLVSTNLNETLEVTTIVLTMFDARTRLSVDVANEVRQHFSERVCRVMIPRTVRLSEAPSFGQPITVFDPASRGAVAYRELAKEVSNGAPQRTR